MSGKTLIPNVTQGTSAASPAAPMSPFDTGQRRSATEGKFKRFAQYAPPPQMRQPNDWAQILDTQTRVTQVLSTTMGGQHQQVMRRLNPLLVHRETILKAKISQAQVYISQWEQDIRSGAGLADPTLPDKMRGIGDEMARDYDALLSIYSEMMQVANQEYSFIAPDGESGAGGLSYQSLQRALMAKIATTRVERDLWLKRALGAPGMMRAQLQDVTKIQPMEAATDALTKAFGADYGMSAALGAAHLQKSQQLAQAEKDLEAMGDLSAVQRAHLRRQRLEEDAKAVQTITQGPAERGGIPPDQRAQIFGV